MCVFARGGIVDYLSALQYHFVGTQVVEMFNDYESFL